ncbi:kinase-like protein [Pholiota conissans]|uniref:Kinase-like protein n=1 Tax=Pholiota conissans TaxID=109636 RepID=A0A9P5ZD68_9AGAR|nr:kinase-like protein [Pholiota conissans]
MAFPFLPLPLTVKVGKRRAVVGSREPTPEDTFKSAAPDVTFRREYTVLKLLSHRHEPDHVSNTTAFCEWHTPASLDQTLPPLLKMTRFGATKRIVILKSRLSGGRRAQGGLNELEILRALPLHMNVVALRDYFFTFYGSYQVNLVLDSMEGNLYHLTRCRKGRQFAGGLVSSILHQVALGLHHIHSHGWLHFNLCPENILVTTTCVHQYPVVYSSMPDEGVDDGDPDCARQRDVAVIIKLAGFDLARPLAARIDPADMEAGFHWYRAPEVILQDPAHSAPVDMWAFGAVMGEVMGLEPLFPGTDDVFQLVRIAEVLGAPTKKSACDARDQPDDAGTWEEGWVLARNLGVTIPQIPPQSLRYRFSPPPPASLLTLLRRLLMYDPRQRQTSKECLDHVYFRETEFHRTVVVD